MSNYKQLMLLRAFVDVSAPFREGNRHVVKISHDDLKAAAHGKKLLFRAVAVLIRRGDSDAGASVASVGHGDEVYEWKSDGAPVINPNFIRTSFESSTWHKYGSDLWISMKKDVSLSRAPIVYIEFTIKPRGN